MRNVASHAGFGEGPDILQASVNVLRRRQRGKRRHRPEQRDELESTGDDSTVCSSTAKAGTAVSQEEISSAGGTRQFEDEQPATAPPAGTGIGGDETATEIPAASSSAARGSGDYSEDESDQDDELDEGTFQKVIQTVDELNSDMEEADQDGQRVMYGEIQKLFLILDRHRSAAKRRSLQ